MLPSAVKFKISFFIFLLDYIHIQYIDGAVSLRGYTCPIGQFRCDSGHCIDQLQLCDGAGDCDDSSDETVIVCNLEQCPSIAFKCDYGACIHMNGRCNGLEDCIDGSDERCCSNIKFSDLTGCKLPDNPLHGDYVVINSLSAGYNPGDTIPIFSVLTLNCNNGFVVNPPEDDGLSYCLPTLEWMPVPKTCARMSLFSAGCRVPNNPSHGKYVVINHVSAGYKPGDIAPVFSLLTVNCNSGYVINPLEGNLPSYCLATEQWSSAPHTCTVMPFHDEGCRLPNNPLNGKYVITDSERLSIIENLSNPRLPKPTAPVDSLLFVNCNEGYEVSSSTDNKPSKCKSTGSWVPPPKTCFQGCIFPADPLNGEYVEEIDKAENVIYYPGDFFPVNKSLLVNCNEGYEVSPLTDNDPSKCKSTGNWVPSPKTCIPGCRLPDNPMNGEYVVENDQGQNDEYYPGDVVPWHKLLSINCNEGYDPSTEDNNPSNCTSTGNWIPSPKICIPIYEFPNNSLNGEYDVVGHTSTVLPFHGEECPLPYNPQNGKYVISDSQGLPIENLFDVEDYEDEIDASLPRLPKPTLPVGTLLSVNCNKGYEVSSSTDDAPSKCTSTGKWIPAEKTCVRSLFDSKGCQVPSRPSHGKYVINNNLTPDHYPGDFVPVESVLSVKCTMGYASNPSDAVNLSVCDKNGKWIPEPKTCARACPSLISTNTTNVACEFNGQPLKTCSNAIENTTARLSCAPFYEEANMEKYPTRLCQDGSWKNPIPQCYPICGKFNPIGSINYTTGMVTIKTDYPWHVNVYKNGSGEKKFICRGFIIKEGIVISAARCFADDEGKRYAKEDFLIAAAKVYNSYNDIRDINPQYSRVHSIHIPESFKGINNYYKSDIAVVILSAPFKLTANVEPVCIDLETVQDEKSNDNETVTGLDPIHGNLGDKIFTMFNTDTDWILPYDKCSEIVKEENKKYITSDKFCLIYKNSGKSGFTMNIFPCVNGPLEVHWLTGKTLPIEILFWVSKVPI